MSVRGDGSMLTNILHMFSNVTCVVIYSNLSHQTNNEHASQQECKQWGEAAAYFLDLGGGGDGALVRPRAQRRHDARLDDLGDGPERAGAVDGAEDEAAEPGVLAAVDVDHAGDADELRRGPADAESAVLGAGRLQDELVGRRGADEHGRRAKEVRPVHAARAVAPSIGVHEAVGAAR